MAGNSSRRGTGSGASGAGFRRTGTQPGAARRGAFIVYTDTPETVVDTMFRMRWKLATVITGFMILAVAIYLLQLGSDGGADPNLVATDDTKETVEVSQFQPPEIVVDFLNAPTLQDKLKFVRNPDEMAKHVLQFYQGNAYEPDLYSSIDPVNQATATPGIEKFYVSISGDQRLAALVETPNGKKIDWPAFARLSDVNWDTFQKGDTTGSYSFRVHINELDYYAGDFADPQSHKCFQISSPELNRDLFGYAERGSQTEKDLSQFSAPVKRRCILELAPPAAPEARQLRIIGLVTQDWILLQ